MSGRSLFFFILFYLKKLFFFFAFLSSVDVPVSVNLNYKNKGNIQSDFCPRNIGNNNMVMLRTLREKLNS